MTGTESRVVLIAAVLIGSGVSCVTETGTKTFYLYKKGEEDHFFLEKAYIDADEFFPKGVGVAKDEDIAAKMAMGVSNLEVVLVDPLTREVICKTPKLDRSGKPAKDRRGDPIMENNDQWFIMNFKLAWREGPEKEDTGTPSMAVPGGVYPGF